MSSDRDREQTIKSPVMQRRAIQRWADHNGVTIVGEHEDRNRSGGLVTRRGLDEALARVPHEAEGLVVYKSARWMRNMHGGLNMLKELEGRGAWIAASDGSIDLSTARARKQTRANMNEDEYYIDELKEIAGLVHDRTINDDGRHMGPAAFGYLRDERDGRLVLDEERHPVVLEILTRRAGGTGWAELERDLRDRDVRDVHGRFLTAQRITNIVKRRTYLGEAFHGGRALPGAHPAIPGVDEVLWAAANRVAPKVASPRAGSSPDLLVGMCRCAGCSYGLGSSRQRTAPTRAPAARCAPRAAAPRRTSAPSPRSSPALRTSSSRSSSGTVPWRSRGPSGPSAATTTAARPRARR